MNKKFAVGCGGAVVVLGLLAAMVLIAGCSSYNRLVGLNQRVDAQWAQVQNQYQRRADLVPNLVKTVSGAANFEKSTLTEVINARAAATQVRMPAAEAPSAEQLAQFEKSQNQLSSALGRLLVVVEKYPDLKANANFRDLQAQLEGTENRIAVERQRYNESVMGYNEAVLRFPTVIWARMLGFPKKGYFQAAAGAETPPQVDFNFNRAPGSAK